MIFTIRAYPDPSIMFDIRAFSDRRDSSELGSFRLGKMNLSLLPLVCKVVRAHS